MTKKNIIMFISLFFLNLAIFNNSYPEKISRKSPKETFVQKVWNFVCEHKVAIAATCAVSAAAFATCFLAYKKFGGDLQTGSDLFESKYNIINLETTGQKGLECGLHAIKNAIIFNDNNDETKIAKLLQDKEYAEKNRDKYAGALGSERFDELESNLKTKEESIESLKKDPKKKDQLEKEEKEKQDLEKRIKNFNIDSNNFFTDEIGAILKKECKNIPVFPIWSSEDYYQNLYTQSKDSFAKNGTSQSFIVRDGYHWYAAKIMKDSESEDGVKVFVADSIGGNRKRSRALDKVIKWYLE